MPVDHYENFPVASWLLPAAARLPIEAIYGFARAADDVADEGDLAAAQRLAELDRFLRALDAIESRREPEPEFARLAIAVGRYHLPTGLLRDLIDAFKQDVVKKRYASFAELMDYSRRSANPIGRLVLHVFEITGSESVIRAARITDSDPVICSDSICSALQLINFWQDVAVDWKKDRVYIPQEDLARFGVAESQIADGRADDRWRELMAFECRRAREMLLSGVPLTDRLRGRMRLEIRATIAGGAAILDKIDAVSGDVFRGRPVLKPLDWLRILARTASGKPIG